MAATDARLHVDYAADFALPSPVTAAWLESAVAAVRAEVGAARAVSVRYKRRAEPHLEWTDDDAARAIAAIGAAPGEHAMVEVSAYGPHGSASVRCEPDDQRVSVHVGGRPAAETRGAAARIVAALALAAPVPATRQGVRRQYFATVPITAQWLDDAVRTVCAQPPPIVLFEGRLRLRGRAGSEAALHDPSAWLASAAAQWS